MGKKSSDPPDVRGAALTEGEMSRETARDVTYADRPDQYNPFGSVEWDTQVDIDPSTGEEVTRWVQNQSYAPQLQGLIDQNLDVVGGRSQLAGMLNQRIGAEMGAEPDWAQFGDVIPMDFDPTELRGRAEDAYYERETSRLDPQFQNLSRDLEIKLRNQGLRPGDQAYDSQIQSLGNQQTDAYERARLGAVQGGMAESNQMFNQQMQQAEMANQLRNQQIDEYLGQRGFSLGESDSLMQGQTLQDISNIVSGGGE